MFNEIEKIAVAAGKVMLEAVNIEEYVSEKSSNSDIVTEYDVKIQNMIFENLRKLCPDAFFFGEEDSSAEAKRVICEKAFIVDPIDGTTNFVRNLRKSAVSIAYAESGEVVYACCYVPYADELFTAEKGKGAYLNGKRIVKPERSVKHSLVGFGTSPYMKDIYTDVTFSIARTLFENTMDVRRVGSAVIDLLDVACGRLDIFYEMRLSPWDYAAASLIASEAGATVTSMGGEKLVPDRKRSVLAASKSCRDFFDSNPEIQKYKELF